MRELKPTCRLAVVQAEPKLFDKEAGLQQTLVFIRRAAAQGAELIVFPELFIPGYPFGMNFGFSTGMRAPEGRQDWQRYYDASILVPGPETEAIGFELGEDEMEVGIGIHWTAAVGTVDGLQCPSARCTEESLGIVYRTTVRTLHPFALKSLLLLRCLCGPLGLL